MFSNRFTSIMEDRENNESLPYKETEKEITVELVAGLGFYRSQEFTLQRKLTWRYLLNVHQYGSYIYCSCHIICSPCYQEGKLQIKIHLTDSFKIPGCPKSFICNLKCCVSDNLLISKPKVTMQFLCLMKDLSAFTMCVNVEWGCYFSNRDVTEPARTDPDYSIKKLMDCLSTSRLTDMVFVVEEEEIPAHRAILGAMSKVFQSMFSLDAIEKSTGRVVVTDATAAGMKRMLRCLYTSWEPEWDGVGDKDLVELVYLANKYEVEPLLEYCTRRMVETLCVENVCMMLEAAASTLSLQGVIDRVHNLLKDNRTVFQSEEWKSLEKNHPAIAIEVFRITLGVS